MARIIRSVKEQIVLNLMPYNSAHGMWEFLKKIYTRSNNALRLQLEFELTIFSQDSRSIEKFYTKFSNL